MGQTNLKRNRKDEKKVEIILTVGAWIVFASLCIFVIFSGKASFTESHKRTVRKVWYLIFIFGSLLALSVNNVGTLFTNWENYLVVLIAFIIFDSLLFLELHFSKLGGQELMSAREQVGITQEVLDSVQRKIGHLPVILTNFEFVLYNLDKKSYISQLEEFLNGYAAKENLIINLLPYGNDEEKDIVFSSLEEKSRGKAERFLSQGDSLSLLKDSLALYPFKLLNYDYVAQVETIVEDEKITKVDGTAITTLIVTYNLTVEENTIEGGEGL